MEEDLEFHPLFDKFKKYSVQDDDVRVIQYHKLADSLRLIGIILVIDGHIEKLMAKYCPKYIPKEQQVSKVGCIFPLVISSEFRMRQNRDGDHREDAPHFTFACDYL